MRLPHPLQDGCGAVGVVGDQGVGADALITDYPDRAAAVLQGMG